jgi:hypothetical protein
VWGHASGARLAFVTKARHRCARNQHGTDKCQSTVRATVSVTLGGTVQQLGRVWRVRQAFAQIWQAMTHATLGSLSARNTSVARSAATLRTTGRARLKGNRRLYSSQKLMRQRLVSNTTKKVTSGRMLVACALLLACVAFFVKRRSKSSVFSAAKPSLSVWQPYAWIQPHICGIDTALSRVDDEVVRLHARTLLVRIQFLSTLASSRPVFNEDQSSRQRWRDEHAVLLGDCVGEVRRLCEAVARALLSTSSSAWRLRNSQLFQHSPLGAMFEELRGLAENSPELASLSSWLWWLDKRSHTWHLLNGVHHVHDVCNPFATRLSKVDLANVVKVARTALAEFPTWKLALSHLGTD